MSDFDLSPANSALLLIDMQERFLPAIPAIAADQGVGRACRILVEAARALGVGVIATEQYPKGLGPTLPHLAAALGPAPRLAKTSFSCLGDDGIAAAIAAAGVRRWVLCGIEAHVCVLATVADLRARGDDVVVAGDAVASRLDGSRDMALAAARDLGALCVPAESIAFRWLRAAQGPAFKQISALVR